MSDKQGGKEEGKAPHKMTSEQLQEYYARERKKKYEVKRAKKRAAMTPSERQELDRKKYQRKKELKEQKTQQQKEALKKAASLKRKEQRQKKADMLGLGSDSAYAG